MKRSLWLLPWDVAGRDPDTLLDELQALGMDRVRLALSYHGGRMLLPRHPARIVVEHLSAVYVPLPPDHFGRLRPTSGEQAGAVQRFLVAAQRRAFPVLGWTVLCHHDQLGLAAPDCCVENAFGERYLYALCPTHPDVQEYVVALCGALAATGVVGLDLEALSYLGYEHQSLHDKRGVPLPPLAAWLLSVCLCGHCRREIDDGNQLAGRIRDAVRCLLNTPTAAPVSLHDGLMETLGAEALAALLALRQRVLLPLLQKLRAATNPATLNLRLAIDPLAHGGKTTLPLTTLPGLVDEATITFFGASLARMETELAALPPLPRPVPLHGGFVLHEPDCTSHDDFACRVDLLTRAQVEEIAFYSYSMASGTHLSWLRPAVKEMTS